MKLDELKSILKRLYREYVKKYIKRILLSLFLSIIVAGSTAATAWLLDPAVKKIFIDKNQTLAWLIPIAIVIAFSAKGISLYFARINVVIVDIRKKTSSILAQNAKHLGIKIYCYSETY